MNELELEMLRGKKTIIISRTKLYNGKKDVCQERTGSCKFPWSLVSEKKGREREGEKTREKGKSLWVYTGKIGNSTTHSNMRLGVHQSW